MVQSSKKPNKAKRKNKGEGSLDSVLSKVWQPRVDKMEEGEELQCDPSAYNSLHAFHIRWPCMRQRKVVGTRLEFLSYLIYLEKGGTWCQPRRVMMIWTVKVVTVLKKKQLFCSCARCFTKDVLIVYVL